MTKFLLYLGHVESFEWLLGCYISVISDARSAPRNLLHYRVLCTEHCRVLYTKKELTVSSGERADVEGVYFTGYVKSSTLVLAPLQLSWRQY